GALAPADASEKLERLAEAGVYSIEQPIAPGQTEAMAALSAAGSLRIALDEELIPVQKPEAMANLLDTVRPAMIVLKPSLIGGFVQAERWIALAEARGIGWWVTSALESNIGLNAIAQWAASRNPASTQGLGTGSLYANNFASPLELRGDALWFDPERPWDVSALGL
ncbi:MAG: enolase C-terminal domain-like protein, partial [Fimbriimonadaceae bacterium]